MYKSIEELTLNTWPAEQSVLLQGWVIRSAAGYTKRANSVSPLYGEEESGNSLMRKIQLVEQYYENAGLKPIFKITPYAQPESLDEALAACGYTVVEPSSVRVMNLMNLPSYYSSGAYEVCVQNELSEEWLEAFAEMTELSTVNRNTMRRMLSATHLKQGFALLKNNGIPSVCGLGVIQHGYIGLYDIVTATAYRRQGMAEHLLLELLHWGKRQGATDSFLQVVLTNQGASALYDKLGYKEIYQYWYRVRS